MTRKRRKYSNSGVYHIMIKGIDSQDIFYNDYDKKVFLKYIDDNKKFFRYKIYAYCLMNNHVHLVMKVEKDILSNAMKSLEVRYSLYFNNKYLRSGPLFQNRFNSKSVENQRYFLDLCRYVHQNPEKAEICNVQDYKWSSYHEYVGKEFLIDKKVLLYYFEYNIEEFKKFTLKNKSYNKYDFIEYELRTKFEDTELIQYIIDGLKLDNIGQISKMKEEELEKSIEFLKNMKYTNLNQISRVTRINRWKLDKFFNN